MRLKWKMKVYFKQKKEKNGNKKVAEIELEGDLWWNNLLCYQFHKYLSSKNGACFKQNFWVEFQRQTIAKS